MNKTVVDFSAKSKAADITLSLTKLKKLLWENDRKTHNKMKQHWNDIKTYRERTRYWVMMDPEVYPERLENMLTEILEIINDSLSKVETTYTKEYLNSVKNEAEALKVLIAIDEHKPSFFNQ